MGEKGKARKEAQQAQGTGSGSSNKPSPVDQSNMPQPVRDIAGPMTQFEDRTQHDGMPSVSQPGIVYQLRPQTNNQGQPIGAVSRPFIITSVDSSRQRCNGFVLIEPIDTTPVNSRVIGSLLCYVENVPSGGPGQPDTWHYVSKGYTGKIGGFTGHRVEDLPKTEDVSQGN